MNLVLGWRLRSCQWHIHCMYMPLCSSILLATANPQKNHPSSRAAPVEYSAAPGQARAAISSHLRPRGRLERPFRAICGSGPSSSGHIRAICGPGAGSSGHFEPSAAPGGFERRHFEPAAAPGKARAAISRQLRLRGGLERPFRAICGSGAGFDESCGVSSSQGEQLSHGGPKAP